jgi:hypothetical protein
MRLRLENGKVVSLWWVSVRERAIFGVDDRVPPKDLEFVADLIERFASLGVTFLPPPRFVPDVPQTST